jgi:hypothetical protein
LDGESEGAPVLKWMDERTIAAVQATISERTNFYRNGKLNSIVRVF